MTIVLQDFSTSPTPGSSGTSTAARLRYLSPLRDLERRSRDRLLLRSRDLDLERDRRRSRDRRLRRSRDLERERGDLERRPPRRLRSRDRVLLRRL